MARYGIVLNLSRAIEMALYLQLFINVVRNISQFLGKHPAFNNDIVLLGIILSVYTPIRTFYFKLGSYAGQFFLYTYPHKP